MVNIFVLCYMELFFFLCLFRWTRVVHGFSSVQFSRSVASDSLRPHESQHARPPCPSPTPGFTQTHIHQVSDAIQLSHPLMPSSPSALSLSQHQGLFQWVVCSHQITKILVGSSVPWQKLEGVVFYALPSSHLTTACAALCYCCSVTQSCLLFATPWTAAYRGSLFLTISQSLPKFMFILSVAIQLSHPLMPSSSILNLSQYHILFKWVVCYQMTKIQELQLQHQYFQWIFRVDLPYDWLVWSPCCPRDFQESFPALSFKGINSLVLCLLYVQFSQPYPRRPQPWLYGPLSAEWCLCFSTHWLGLSLLSCQEAVVFWFHGCSPCPQ